jgi:hypothetical protein
MTPKSFATVTLQLKKEFVAMKRALAGVLAIAFVGLMAAGATAQVPFFQVYFDDDSNGSYGETQANCGPVNGQQNLYLVLLNANTFVAALDYKISFPAGIMWLQDNYPELTGGTLNIGTSPEGNAVAYNLPRNGFLPILVITINSLWTGACNGCADGPQPLVVGGYPGKTSPTFIRWPDIAEFGAVGMTSLLCPGPVSTQSTTWGGVKALYR